MKGGRYAEKVEPIVVVVFVRSIALAFFKCRSTEKIGVDRPRNSQFYTSLNGGSDHQLCG
jgi:hypothetical protein